MHPLNSMYKIVHFDACAKAEERLFNFFKKLKDMLHICKMKI